MQWQLNKNPKPVTSVCFVRSADKSKLKNVRGILTMTGTLGSPALQHCRGWPLTFRLGALPCATFPAYLATRHASLSDKAPVSYHDEVLFFVAHSKDGSLLCVHDGLFSPQLIHLQNQIVFANAPDGPNANALQAPLKNALFAVGEDLNFNFEPKQKRKTLQLGLVGISPNDLFEDFFIGHSDRLKSTQYRYAFDLRKHGCSRHQGQSCN